MDLVVIDVKMGVMDGIQMLSMLNRGYPNVQKVGPHRAMPARNTGRRA